MKKIETIWHHLLWSALERHIFQHTQAALAADFSYSLSTVNLALAKPAAIGAIRKSGKFFVLSDVRKLLYLWATTRNLAHDILYTTKSPLPVSQLEGLAPPEAIYGGYSAGVKLLGSAPADYTQAYLYLPLSSLTEAQKRFPKSTQGNNEIIILRALPVMKRYGKTTTLPWTFTDVWNMRDWYAADFTGALEEKIYGLLS